MSDFMTAVVELGGKRTSMAFVMDATWPSAPSNIGDPKREPPSTVDWTCAVLKQALIIDGLQYEVEEE